VRVFRANIWDYRLDEKYDIIYSSGVLHYTKPELRNEIMENYKSNINNNGIAALHVFVHKPFIPPSPDDGPHYLWKSGQLFTYFHDWHIDLCEEVIFNCNSTGIPHRHSANRIIARCPNNEH